MTISSRLIAIEVAILLANATVSFCLFRVDQCDNEHNWDVEHQLKFKTVSEFEQFAHRILSYTEEGHPNLNATEGNLASKCLGTPDATHVKLLLELVQSGRHQLCAPQHIDKLKEIIDTLYSPHRLMHFFITYASKAQHLCKGQLLARLVDAQLHQPGLSYKVGTLATYGSQKPLSVEYNPVELFVGAADLAKEYGILYITDRVAESVYEDKIKILIDGCHDIEPYYRSIIEPVSVPATHGLFIADQDLDIDISTSSIIRPWLQATELCQFMLRIKYLGQFDKFEGQIEIGLKDYRTDMELQTSHDDMGHIDMSEVPGEINRISLEQRKAMFRLRSQWTEIRPEHNRELIRLSPALFRMRNQMIEAMSKSNIINDYIDYASSLGVNL